MNSLRLFLKYARFRYILYRIFLRIKLGKTKRNEYFNKTAVSVIDFLPERTYSLNDIKLIPRKGTHDYFMFFIPREADVLQHLTMNKDEIFLDIGANIGSYALRIAKHYKEMGVNVIAIEAHPDNYKALCRNIQCNKLENIKTVNKAVAGHKGLVKMYERFHSGKRLGSDLYSIHDTFLGPSNVFKQDGKVIQVECDKLDNILHSIEIDDVHVMKMDIEGAEALALQGASNTLQRLRKVIVEVHGDNLEAVRQILESHGFQIMVTNAAMNHVIGTKYSKELVS